MPHPVLQLVSLLTIAAGPAAERPAVAVFDIQDNRPARQRAKPRVIRDLTEYLSAQLGRGQTYRIVPTSEVRAALADEKRESYKECYDDECQIEIGKEVAADKSLATRIGRIGRSCVVVASLYDLTIAATDQTATARVGCGEDELLFGIDSVVSQLTGARPSGTKRRATRDESRGRIEHGIATVRREAVENTPSGETAFILIRTQPTGASIRLNEEAIGQAPIQVERPLGSYVIEATKPQYRSAVERLVLDKAGAQVDLDLEPSFGSIHITTKPDGATIWLNGEAVGTAPVSLERKPAGTYKVRAEAPLHLPESRDVVVREGSDTRVDVELSANYGELRVESTPSGAAIQVDGQTTEHKTPHRFKRMQAGFHVIELALEGYGTFRERVEVKRLGKERLSARLAEKLGTLAVTAVYDDAKTGAPCVGTIFVDGKRAGRTPAKLQLTATSHEVRVECPKASSTRSIQVRHNARDDLHLVLSTKEAVARREKAALDALRARGVLRRGPLLWTQRSVGRMLWNDARAACSRYRVMNYTDWRLPTIDEINSIAVKQPGFGKDYRFVEGMPALDARRGRGTGFPTFWSSTACSYKIPGTNSTSTDNANSFSRGGPMCHPRSFRANRFEVLCVHDWAPNAPSRARRRRARVIAENALERVDDTEGFGACNNRKTAQSFQPTVTARPSHLSVYVTRVGNPRDSIVAKIYAGAARPEDGVLVAETEPLRGSTLPPHEALPNLPTTTVELEFKEQQKAELEAGKLHYLVLERSGAKLDCTEANMYRVGVRSKGTYRPGHLWTKWKSDAPSAWDAWPLRQRDLSFEILTEN